MTIKNFNDWEENLNLMQQALRGDEQATKLYCGSYNLIQNNKTKEYFRCKGDTPVGFIKIEGVYDLEGFLLSRYWSLNRI